MTDDLRERLAGHRVVASISGGKDSAAMSLWFTEQGIEHDRVFMDTGWEHPLVYEYLRGELARVIGPVKEISGPLKMVDLILNKGMFPSRNRRYCTQHLKIYPMRDYLAALQDAGEDPINSVGIRAAESEARSKLAEWEWNDLYDCEVWRPLISWTEQQVIDIHRRHGLAPNPLYLEPYNAHRVGCWPCIFSIKSELRLIADIDPARVALIRDLEAKVQAKAAERYAAKGETFESLGYQPPTFFQAMGAMRSEGRDGRAVPIDEVVRWARTAHGGRQFELFSSPDGDRGCVRWGLCETARADEPSDDDEEKA